MFSSSLTWVVKVGEVFLGGSSFAKGPCGGGLGLHVGTWTDSDAPDDREVREEEGEAPEDEARDADLSGLIGFFLCFSGEVGEIPFGESVGVPL